MCGKLIVIEGLDGSGKATQSKLLYETLLAEGKPVRKVSFPNYESNSSALVKMYLAGEFGKNPEDVNAYAASTFFAVDRYASYKSNWGKFYADGGIVIADHYTTSIAIQQCKLLTIDMAALACNSVLKAMDIVANFNEADAAVVAENEKTVDVYEDRLGTYLVNLSSQRISAADSHEISKLLHSISDIERISDHALSIAITARGMAEKNIRFSEQGQAEFQVITNAVREVLSITERCFDADDPIQALRVEPLEQVVDYLSDSLRARHIQRLQEGTCSVDQGLIFTDLLSDYRRVSDHCSNIAAAIIELQHNSYDTHQYLGALKKGNENFAQLYESYMAQFPLPQ